MNRILRALPASSVPATEADLHAYADGQLPQARCAAMEAYLSDHPEDNQRVENWRAQSKMLRRALRPVLEEPIPLRLTAARPSRNLPWGRLAAGVAIAAVSASSAWFVRGMVPGHSPKVLASAAGSAQLIVPTGDTFYQRAAVAHLVYAPEVRRPVEVGADQEQALVTWLTKRLGTAVKPPRLGALGYELVGGRLLPGGSGPVAQFMYAAAGGQRLTLYVTREAAGKKTAFQFNKDGPVNVFYWVDEHFGYALSGAADRAELLRVSEEVYRQLG